MPPCPMPRLALVVNEPPPYRIPVFNRLAALPGMDLRVIFCCRREPNRLWNLPRMEFNHAFLRERVLLDLGRISLVQRTVILGLAW